MLAQEGELLGEHESNIAGSGPRQQKLPPALLDSANPSVPAQGPALPCVCKHSRNALCLRRPRKAQVVSFDPASMSIDLACVTILRTPPLPPRHTTPPPLPPSLPDSSQLKEATADDMARLLIEAQVSPE